LAFHFARNHLEAVEALDELMLADGTERVVASDLARFECRRGLRLREQARELAAYAEELQLEWSPPFLQTHPGAHRRPSMIPVTPFFRSPPDETQETGLVCTCSAYYVTIPSSHTASSTHAKTAKRSSTTRADRRRQRTRADGV
jgi:hypothetical protein